MINNGEHLKKVKIILFKSLKIVFFLILALNDKEIFGQALVFFLAGRETVSMLLSFIFYVMATEPVIQEKVYEEIRQEIGDVCIMHTKI
jgi:hypothetical protein